MIVAVDVSSGSVPDQAGNSCRLLIRVTGSSPDRLPDQGTGGRLFVCPERLESTLMSFLLTANPGSRFPDQGAIWD